MGRKSHLTEYTNAVLSTMIMRLTRREALAYLRGQGYTISNTTLGRVRAEIKKNSLSRLIQISSYEFHEQHLNRLDNLEFIAKLMWQEYLRERSPSKRVQILKEITQIQPYLSSYYEASKDVLAHRNGNRQDTSNISENRESIRIPPVE